LVAIGRICCFANAPSIWRMPGEQRVVVEDVHGGYSSPAFRALARGRDRAVRRRQRLEGARVAHQFLDGKSLTKP